MGAKVKLLEKAVKKFVVLLLAIGIVSFSGTGRVFTPSSGFAKCCSHVYVTNFGTLVGLVVKKVTQVIVETIVSKFEDLIAYLKKSSYAPGVLKNWAISELQRKTEQYYVKNYDDIVNTIQDLSTPQNWIKITTGSQTAAIVPPLVGADGTSYGSFSDYGTYVNGDTSIVRETFSSLNVNDLNEEALKYYKIRIRELESTKAALAQEVADLGATAQKLEKLNSEIKRNLKKIDEATASGSYKEEQAVKDLLKLQMLQSFLLLEVLRNQINQEVTSVSYYNQKLVESRNELINDLQALRTKVEGSWTLKSSGSKLPSGK